MVLALLASPLLWPRCPPLAAFLPLLPLAGSSQGSRPPPAAFPFPLPPAEPLPAPTLSSDTGYTLYYEGERVTVVCSAPTARNVAGFRLFNQSGHQTDLRAPFPLPAARFHLAATRSAAGAYTCLYFVEESGREIPSDRSLPLTVKVGAAPPAPTLSLAPQQPVYRYGNDVKLLCSVPPSPAYVKEIQFYADFGFAVSIPVPPNARNSSYDLRITAETPSGSYSCTYFVARSSRPVRSQRSRWINVTVKSRPISLVRDILVGGSFFTVNGLIFFFSRLLAKRRGPEGGGRADRRGRRGGKNPPRLLLEAPPSPPPSSGASEPPPDDAP